MKTVSEIADAFRTAEGVILADYRGLTTSQFSELRLALGDAAVFTVTKNTYAKIAAAEADLAIAPMLTGPSAVAFVRSDPSKAAKVLLDWEKTSPLKVKGGSVEGRLLSVREVEILADTPPREILLAMLAGAMKAHMVKAVTAFTALKEKMDE